MAAAARGEPGGVPSLVLAHFLRQLRTGFGATECTFPPDTPKPPMHITPELCTPEAQSKSHSGSLFGAKREPGSGLLRMRARLSLSRGHARP